MSVKHVSKPAEFANLTGKGLAVVKYSAKWCGPCKRIEPQYNDFAKNNININFLHVDVDEAADSLATQVINVHSVPTFHFYKDGKVVDKQSGGNLAMLTDKINKLKEAAKAPEPKPQSPGASSSGAQAAAAAAAAQKVIEVTTLEQYKSLVASGKTVVDFSAAWCMPCRIIKPVFGELAQKHADVKFLKIDVDDTADELEEVFIEQKITSLPTFLFYADNKVIDELNGANSNVLKRKVESLVAHKEPEKKEPIALSAPPAPTEPKKEEQPAAAAAAEPKVDEAKEAKDVEEVVEVSPETGEAKPEPEPEVVKEAEKADSAEAGVEEKKEEEKVDMELDSKKEEEAAAEASASEPTPAEEAPKAADVEEPSKEEATIADEPVPAVAATAEEALVVVSKEGAVHVDVDIMDINGNKRDEVEKTTE